MALITSSNDVCLLNDFTQDEHPRLSKCYTLTVDSNVGSEDSFLKEVLLSFDENSKNGGFEQNTTDRL